MITIRIRGERQTIHADSVYDLVGRLNRSSLDAQSDQRDWMKLAAERAGSLTGMVVRSDTAAHFIEDLTETGMIEEINGDDRGS
jgi:predicted alpha-1,6-mannanase (GH76 family)